MTDLLFSLNKTTKNIYSSVGLSKSIQSSTLDALQEDQALHKEAELPTAEAVPLMIPLSLEEVQQAVQEASEQVEGRGAEEVLKELLERVVEAARGQVEGGGETKADEAREQEMLGAEIGNNKSVTEDAEEEAKGIYKGDMEKDTDVEQEQEARGVNTYDNVAEAEEGVVNREVEAAAGSEERPTLDVQIGGSEDEIQVVDESVEIEGIHEVVEETVSASEEAGDYIEVVETGVYGKGKQVELLEEKVVSEANTQEEEKTPADVEEVLDSESALDAGVVSDANQAVEETKGEVIVPSDSSEMGNAQTVVGEPIEQEQEVNIVKDAEGPEVADEQAVQGGAAEEVEAEDTATLEAEGGGRDGESVIRDESVTLGNEVLGDQQTGKEEQIASEMSQGSEKDDEGEKWFQSTNYAKMRMCMCNGTKANTE